MPRGSRHRSHRSRKHSRDPSDSEEEESLRDRRSREDESSVRVSRDPEPEKRKSSHAHERRESLVVSNSDASAEHGKKRKERVEDVVVDVDRWNDDEDDDHKRVKAVDSGHSLVKVDAKSSKSSRRHEGSSERDDERTGKVEPVKRKSEKDSSRRESSRSQYKDEKERERRSESEQYRDSKKKDRELVSESGHCKDGKERERERDSESGQGKDMKERERERVIESGQYKDDRASEREKRKGIDQYKDLKERDREQGSDSHQHRDVDERDRARGSEKDKERGSRRDRERASGRDKERNLERDKGHGSERDRERGYEKDRDRDRVARDASFEKDDDSLGRKHSSKIGSIEGHTTRKDRKMNETQAQDVVPSPDPEKGSGRQTRRRDHSEGKEKWAIDSRDGGDKKISSRDDHTKHSRQRDERHDDAKTRDKYTDDFDRDHDERSVRDHSAYKPDNKHSRDESKTLERYKRSRFKDNNHDGSSYIDDFEIRPEDSMGRKRCSDENEVYNELNSRGFKGPHEDIENNVNSLSDKSRSDYRHSDKFDSSQRVNGPKSSASSSAYRDSKQVDFSQRESSEERIRPVTASAGRSSSLVVHSRVSVSRPDRIKSKVDANLSEFYGEFVAPVKYERTSRPDHHSSPSKRKERSPSYNSDWRFSERTGYRRSLDVELGKRSNSLKDEDWGRLVSEKPSADEVPQNPTNNRESTPIGSSSINRTGFVSVNSPNHLPLAPLMRPGLDSPSVMGMHDDDNRSQIGDRKSYVRHKRSGDLGYGRAHGNAWKTAPSWPSPIANGFLPLQHGPPPIYHPGVPQFPPPLYGVRSSMDMAPRGVSFHMHEVAENFPGHGRPFGWHSAVDQPGPPHMQAWDGRNGVFGDESQAFNRPDWDQSRHLLGTRGWEMSPDLWKGENGNVNVDIPVAKKEIEGLTSKHPLTDETQITLPGHELHNKKAQSESFHTESNEAKQSNDFLATNVAGSSSKLRSKKASEPSNIADETIAKYQASYLSRIDISPVLASSELYQKCISILRKSHSNGANTFATNVHSQSLEDGRTVKMKGNSQILSSTFKTANISIFQKAIALYKKQNEISNVKLPASALVSGKENEVAPEASEAFDDTQGVQEMGETASMEEAVPSLANAISNVSIQAGDGESNQTAGCPENEISDPVICANDSQACESLMEDCMVNSYRIPNSPQSTH